MIKRLNSTHNVKVKGWLMIQSGAITAQRRRKLAIQKKRTTRTKPPINGREYRERTLSNREIHQNPTEKESKREIHQNPTEKESKREIHQNPDRERMKRKRITNQIPMT